MAEFNVPEVNASGEFVSPLVKSHVQKLALSVSGPGRPDQVATTQGAITGSEPVGTTYTSTDGANVGAYVWRKRPGGKWAVTDGDTGWRHITAPAITAGGIRFRRVGSTVTVGFGGAQYNTITTGTIPANLGNVGNIPSGFQMAGTQAFGMVTKDGGQVIGHVQITDTSDGNQVRLRSADGVSTGLNNQTLLRVSPVPYICDQPWPTTLPGTPA